MAARTILMLTGSLSRRAGGLFESVRRLAQSLPSDKYTVHVAGIEDDDFAADRSAWEPLVPRAVPYMGPSSFGFAPRLMSLVRDINPDLVHLHGIWMYASTVALRFVHEFKRPLVVSPRGMLDPWVLGHSAWKKHLAWWCYENRNLAAAACLHALNDQELRALRCYGLSNPVCVVPNAVDLPPKKGAVSRGRWSPTAGDTRPVMLFMSRLHEKKGLLPLLRAWCRVCDRYPSRNPGWQLVLAGWGESKFVMQLAGLAAELGIENSVRTVGALHGEAKACAVMGSEAFILPSFSEGMPMAVLEAWAHGLPVIMTDACGLDEGFRQRAAIHTTTDPSAVANSLREMMDMTPDERRAMGMRGQDLVASEFSWSVVSRAMTAVYEWLAGNGPVPHEVRFR